MAKKRIYTVYHRRKRSGKTNYRKRIALLKSNKTRFVVRKSNRNLVVQFIDFYTKGDKVLVTLNSSKLEEYGWKLSKKNIPAAYLLGLLASKKSPVKEAVLDIGLHTPTKGAKIFAVLKGAADGGLNIHYTEGKFSDEERISGAHIGKWLEESKSNKKEGIFSTYIKEKITDKSINDLFIKTRERIIKDEKEKSRGRTTTKGK
ncbi:50S ribosomal protein L18 [Candidatus Woesearchaeota archaeon]|nr:50S ribosomal protein L18 [Candidatus Woesearchaeota archaeon]